jgi:uncharacterized membrane protein YqiK
MYLNHVPPFWWVVSLFLILVAIGHKLVLRVVCGAVIVPQDKIAIVVKKFAVFGANRSLPDGKIVALHGEAGLQADTLAPGLHWGFYPWQYEISQPDLVTVPEAMVGVVESKDGKPLASRGCRSRSFWPAATSSTRASLPSRRGR